MKTFVFSTDHSHAGYVIISAFTFASAAYLGCGVLTSAAVESRAVLALAYKYMRRASNVLLCVCRSWHNNHHRAQHDEADYQRAKGHYQQPLQVPLDLLFECVFVFVFAHNQTAN